MHISPLAQNYLYICSPCIAFSRYAAYKARCQLAAIDYNKHLGRPTKKRDDGSVVYWKKYSKRTKNHFVVEGRQPKSYSYIPDLQLRIMSLYRADLQIATRSVEWEACDARRLGQLEYSKAPDTTLLAEQQI